ncbi:hypothetical protein D8674_035491 [Pyrus ussuriensis x Pyrus communis]|uniref:Uncharacterized protein n=1 Tax=Pyrus ussuriensis x Pyrus communis TaxID=2448454 RepID=A0A5N5GCJ0_9ROSA|nr:hypothetical protein D8674_035491 [Pyrus ussuriensis x Pyrus communis]
MAEAHFSPNPKTQLPKLHNRRRKPLVVIPRAAGPSSEPTNNGGGRKTKTKTKNKTVDPASTEEKSDSPINQIQEQQEQKQNQKQLGLDLEDVNPVGLGRRSRQLFDEVWRKFSGLGQISRTSLPDERDALDALLIREGPMCEFVIPGAQNTTVLVVGATSSIGRIVVRKLMLRGNQEKSEEVCPYHHR